MFTTEVFEPGLPQWEKIRDSIVPMEQEAFSVGGFTEEQLAYDFSNKNNIMVLLKEKDSGTIIGYTYARPIEDAEASRANEKGETVFIWNTVIKKEYRGRKLVGVLMGALEDELRRRKYKYIERDAVVANNYAENISKFYKDRIIKSEEHDSTWGPQVFFRIRL